MDMEEGKRGVMIVCERLRKALFVGVVLTFMGVFPTKILSKLERINKAVFCNSEEEH